MKGVKLIPALLSSRDACSAAAGRMHGGPPQARAPSRAPLCPTHGGYRKSQKIAAVFYPVVPVLCGLIEHPDSTLDLKERELKVLLYPLLGVQLAIARRLRRETDQGMGG